MADRKFGFSGIGWHRASGLDSKIWALPVRRVSRLGLSGFGYVAWRWSRNST